MRRAGDFTFALSLLAALLSCTSLAHAQPRTALVVQWQDPSAAELASVARGTLTGAGATLISEEETSAALAFLGDAAALDDERARRLAESLNTSVLYVVAVLPAADDRLNVALRTFDGGPPRSVFGRSTREDLAAHVAAQLLAAATAPPEAASPEPTEPPPPPAPSAHPAAASPPADHVLEPGIGVEGHTATGFDRYSPSCAAVGGSPDESWTFVAPASATYRFHVEATYDSVLALRAPNGTELACNDDTNNARTSQLHATLVEGRSYQVVVDGFRGAAGSYQLSVAEGTPSEPALSNEGGGVILLLTTLAVSVFTDVFGYYGVCEESALCDGHVAISWIPVLGPWITLATQPQINDSEVWYGVMGGAELLTLGVAILVLASGSPATPVDTTPPPVEVRFDLRPTEGGALATLRGEWR